MPTQSTTHLDALHTRCESLLACHPGADELTSLVYRQGLLLREYAESTSLAEAVALAEGLLRHVQRHLQSAVPPHRRTP